MEPEGQTGTYHCLLHINLLPPRKAKVSNLGGQILSDQHIAGSQVPVDELQAWSAVRDEHAQDSWATEGADPMASPVFVATRYAFSSPFLFFPPTQASAWISDSCQRKFTVLAVIPLPGTMGGFSLVTPTHSLHAP